MRMSKKEFEKDENRRKQQRLKEEFSKAVKEATTSPNISNEQRKDEKAAV